MSYLTCEKCGAMRPAHMNCRCPKPEGSLAPATGWAFWDELLQSLELLSAGHEKHGEYSSAFACTEARRRLINQRSHVEALHKALDGLPIKHIPGAGMDGHRDARNIRAVVEHLPSPNPEVTRVPLRVE
jgi:hypothetical protein